MEWIATTSSQVTTSDQQPNSEVNQHYHRQLIYGYAIGAVFYISVLMYTGVVDETVTQLARTNTAVRRKILSKRRKYVYYVLMHCAFCGIYGFVTQYWGLILECTFHQNAQHTFNNCYPVGNILLVMFMANGGTAYLILILYFTRQLKLTKEVLNSITLTWTLYMAMHTLVFAVPWTIYKIYCICARKCKKIQYKYASKVYVKFWNPSEPENNSCITCHNHLNLPSDAITNELPKRCCRLRQHRGVVVLLQKNSKGSGRVVPDDEDTAVTLCGHVYHVSCLKACLNVNHLCPMCRCETELTSCYFIVKSPTHQEAASDDDSEAVEMIGV